MPCEKLFIGGFPLKPTVSNIAMSVHLTHRMFCNTKCAAKVKKLVKNCFSSKNEKRNNRTRCSAGFSRKRRKSL